jgi:hypothetical protein
MKKITITNEQRAQFVELLESYEANKHLEKLKIFFTEDTLDMEQILTYGLPYLPNIIDAHGNKNLDLLEGFVPQVVEYYEVLGELPFLPNTITDLCTDLSLYANSQSIEISSSVYEFSPASEIEKALA